jgi:hypothetical protein
LGEVVGEEGFGGRGGGVGRRRGHGEDRSRCGVDDVRHTDR